MEGAQELETLPAPVPTDSEAQLAGSEEKEVVSEPKVSTREWICFFFFGVLNNFSYIVMLTAAKDILLRGSAALIPVGVVLLADIVPCLLVKATAALYLNKIRDSYRVHLIVSTLFVSFHIVAWPRSIPLKIVGIALSSASSGLGEVTFMSLTHAYHPATVQAFSSGTGGAGLVAAGLYLLATSVLHLALSLTLALFSLLVLALELAYWMLPLKSRESHPEGTPVIEIHGQPINKRELLKPLIVRYVLPVALTYLAQYLINQGINPTIYFKNAPFSERDHYVLYQTLYQVTAFIGKSTSKWWPIRHIWLLTALQWLNVLLLLVHALRAYLSLWLVCALVLYEGYIAGAIYVNTFYLVRTEVAEPLREFALQVTSAGDAIGVSAAGVAALFVEPFILAHRTV